MAEVWMGRRRAMGGASKAVAIKLLAPHLASKAIYRRMFVDEARLTMMLTHSNIVQVFDVGEEGGRSYLVMEWIDGLDLSRLAHSMRERGERFPLAVVAHVIGEVLRGLAYAHGLTEGENSSTIVHRDISPQNVLISVSGEVKVSDFGVARLASEETSGLHVRGKLRYMPPEQVRGKSKRATIDLFAVGAMLQELLDGGRFRAGLERAALFGMVIAGEVPPLARAQLPAELVALRDGLLEADPDQRLQSAEDALALLGRWSGYRNATDELAALVRGSAGVSAPRTGLTLDVSDDELEIERDGDNEDEDEETMSEASSQQDCSELATRVVPTRGGSETTPTPHLSELPPERARWVTRITATAVLLLGLGLGFVYAYGAGGVALDEELARAPAELEPAVVASLASASAGIRASASAGIRGSNVEGVGRVAAPAEEEGGEGEIVASTSTPSAAKAKVPAKAKAKAPASVEFAAHEFFFVWVKVGGQVLALEPTAKLDLPPGRHKVWLREAKGEPWQAAGRIKVGAGGRYRVSLRRPASVVLSAR